MSILDWLVFVAYVITILNLNQNEQILCCNNAVDVDVDVDGDDDDNNDDNESVLYN